MHRTIRRGLAIVLVAGLGAASLVGCKEEGAAEKAGKALDEALDDAKDEIEEAKE